MADIDDLRRAALALPETTEGTHFHQASFQVRGKNFAGVQKDGRVTLALDPGQVPGIVAEDPAAFGEIRRFDQPIGIWVDLARVSADRLAQLVELSWRHRAPKKLAAALDARRG